MTKCTSKPIAFSSCKSRKVLSDFSGGEITSDAGVLLLRQADRRLKLTQHIARQMKDTRCKEKCTHTLRDLLRQRVYAICLGYEDLNDHDMNNLRVGYGSRFMFGTEGVRRLGDLHSEKIIAIKTI